MNNYETNPFTNRLVKNCREGHERIPRENGNFKTFKCYKRCNSNQTRHMGTMKCRKKTRNSRTTPSLDYGVYPSPSSVRGSNHLRKPSKKSRTPSLDYGVYPSSSSVRGSNDLRKPKKSRTPSLDYGVYPSSASFRGSNNMTRKTKIRRRNTS